MPCDDSRVSADAAAMTTASPKEEQLQQSNWISGTSVSDVRS
jgi:hypothetical protein